MVLSRKNGAFQYVAYLPVNIAASEENKASVKRMGLLSSYKELPAKRIMRL